MVTKNLVLAACAAIALSIATAHAGPCNTGGKSAQDAGSGPTPGHTEQTVGSAGSANSLSALVRALKLSVIICDLLFTPRRNIPLAPVFVCPVPDAPSPKTA